jgi:hypothetical protein
MERDNPGNILGVNTNNNLYDSSNVVADANGSMIERQQYIQEAIASNALGQAIVRKTVTFDDTDADVPLFTVTGDVAVKLVAVCGTSVASVGGANIGVDAGTVALIADTDCTALAAGEIWHDASPDASAELLSVMKEFILANGTDIVLDVQDEKQVDSGVINFYCIWTPFSVNGKVVAAE